MNRELKRLYKLVVGNKWNVCYTIPYKSVPLESASYYTVKLKPSHRLLHINIYLYKQTR